MDVLISKITKCQSPEERKNKVAVEFISAEALISILIANFYCEVLHCLSKTHWWNHFLSNIFRIFLFVRKPASCETYATQPLKTKHTEQAFFLR